MRITGPIPPHIEKLMPGFKPPQAIQGIGESKADLKGEKELQNLIANELLRNGVYFIRQRMDKKSNTRIGTPDFIVCRPIYDINVAVIASEFIALEVKVGNNHPTIEQNLEMVRIRQSGGKAFVVRSLQEVKRILGI